ncbi:unnamed protein product [Hymenolepis diminuta]|uniref:Coiled-coil domain-containing protein 146 n=1 Tax=Hymenolepis diminuta TaxID=6216 RepID=A0A0R3SQF1_HYMDI|nr:unnamed protein product [Hymenolepis diminuta]
MRRRVASEGSIEESEDSFSDHKTRFKSQNLPSEDLVKTSQVLLDERSNAKQFQQFYSHLKFAHAQLQESHTALEGRFSDALQGWLFEKQLLNEKLNRVLKEKQELECLCIELQKSNFTPERFELIKCDIQSEVQRQYDLKLNKAMRETELARNECNRAIEELKKLKIIHEQLRISFESLHERNALLEESERQYIAESHQEVINRLSAILGSDTETLINLFRENSEIRAQCNIVLDESEKSKRLYDTQVSELKNELIQTIDALTKVKSDKTILARKYEVLQEEAEMLSNSLSYTQTELKAIRRKVVDLGREKMSLEKHLKGDILKLKTELNESRLATEKKRIEMEKQRDEFAFQVQDLTNKMALAMARYEESEAQCQHEFATKEWDLQKCIKETTEASKHRSAQILRQLERAQLNLKELSIQYKELIMTLTESEKSKLEALQKVNQMENQNSELKSEFAMTKQELIVRQKQVKSLEIAMQELMSNDDQIPGEVRNFCPLMI